MRENQSVEDVYIFDKYKSYFESWLNLPIEFIKQATGVHLRPEEIRREKPKGGMLYSPVRALETESAVLISCVPEWENELRALLSDVEVREAISKLSDFSVKGAFISPEYHQFYGHAEINAQLDTAKAVRLEMKHCNAFLDYYKKIKPHMCGYSDSDAWMLQAYEDMIKKGAQFCIFDNDEIVCATDAEDIPGKPDSIINLGINTLPNYRRKGYASIACAAFIKHCIEQGVLPVWQCSFKNSASQSLAKKLGFKYLGNVFYFATLHEHWKDFSDEVV